MSALLAVALLLSVGSFALAESDALPDLAGLKQAAQDLAAKSVPDRNDPRYYASLRYILASQADALRLSDGPVTGTRAVEVQNQTALLAPPSQIDTLLLDSSHAYRAWLLQQAPARALENPADLGTRSIGGNIVKPGDKLFQSVILLRGPGRKFCSAVLLSTIVAVTAAHCLCPARPGHAKPGNDPNADTPPPVLIAKYFKPDSVDCDQLGQSNFQSLLGDDYGLVLLGDPVSPKQANIAPASMIGALAASHTVWIVGFGAEVDMDEDVPSQKNVIQAPIVSAQCQSMSPDAAANVQPSSGTDVYVCAAGAELVSAGRLDDSGKVVHGGPCHGDSGGAVFARPSEAIVGSNDTNLYLIGVTSRPVTDSRHCGDATIYSLLTDNVQSELHRQAAAIFHTSF